MGAKNSSFEKENLNFFAETRQSPELVLEKSFFLETNFKKYLKDFMHAKRDGIKSNFSKIYDENILKIQRNNLLSMMQTVFEVDLIFEILPKIERQEEPIEKFDLIKKKIVEDFNLSRNMAPNEFTSQSVEENIRFSEKLAEKMILSQNQNKLDNDEALSFLLTFNYDKNLLIFEQKSLYYLINTSSIDILNEGEAPNEKVTLKWPHFLIRNFFLTSCLLNISSKGTVPQWLSMVSIIEDNRLMNFLAETIKGKDQILQTLFNVLVNNKNKNSKDANILSANIISLLVAANFSFFNTDLSYLNISGANISDGVFSKCNFSNSNMTNAIMNDCKFSGANFDNTILDKVIMNFKKSIELKDSVCDLSFSKDEKSILAVHQQTLSIHDFTSKKLIKEIETGNECQCASLSPDGKLIACGLTNSLVLKERGNCRIMETIIQIKIFETDSGKEILVLKGHRSPLIAIYFESNDHIISYSKSEIKKWNPQNSSENIFSYEIEKGCEILSAFLPSANLIAFFPSNSLVNFSRETASHDFFNLRHLDSDKVLKIFNKNGHNFYLNRLVFNHEGDQLAISGIDLIYKERSINIFNTITAECIFTFLLSDCRRLFLMFSNKDDKLIVLYPKNLALYNISDKKIIKREILSENPSFGVLTNDDEKLVFYDFECNKDNEKANLTLLNLKEIETPSIKSYLSLKMDCSYEISLSPCKQFLLIGYENGLINLLDLKTEKYKTFNGHKHFISTLEFSSDGKTFLSSSSLDKSIKLWDVKNVSEIIKEKKIKDPVLKITYSSNNNWISVDNVDGIQIMEQNTLKTIKAIKLMNDGQTLKNPVVSKKGKYAASALNNYSLYIFNLEEEKNPKILKGTKEQINSFVFSNNEEKMITIHDGRCINIWDIQNEKLIYSFNYFQADLRTAVWSEEDDKFLTIDQEDLYQVWNISDEKEIQRFKKKSTYFCVLQFSSKSKYILIIKDILYNTKAIIFYDLETGYEKKIISNVPSGIISDNVHGKLEDYMNNF